MSILSTYIPMAWRQAMARGTDLPEETVGAALFADISGFTALTDALAAALGPRRGAEELTVHLNQVYDGLIAQLHRFGGSVIGFSGDAITCWLDGDDGSRAISAGLAMQTVMADFAQVTTSPGQTLSLGITVAVTTGPVRQFVVGDPAQRRLATLAGATVQRLAAGETLAELGDVVVDQATADSLGAALAVAEWRTETDGGAEGERRFAVVAGLDRPMADRPWPDLDETALSQDEMAQWLLPPIYTRLDQGLGEFLAELRPAVALFLRFTGIDYDTDPDAAAKLDTFIREVQHILARFDGSLIQLTIGDKGSYLYAAFGAPIAHEDDDIRAASAALAIQDMAAGLAYLHPLQIGVTRGRMRTGSYGSATRRTYGVLGDGVNLAAGLMSAAEPGQILVTDPVQKAGGDRFAWDRLPPVHVKGKRGAVPVSQLLGLARTKSTGLLEPAYALPMVGRAAELAIIQARLAAALAGRGQIVAIAAEAGMGKSRLASEAIHLAQQQGLTGLAGEAQSFGTTTPYLIWQEIWRGFFGLDTGLDTGLPVARQIATVAAQLEDLDPVLLTRLPLLGPVLNLPIPDNDLTRYLDAKVRKSSLEDLLVQCVTRRAAQTPLLLVLEDAHWMDPLSQDLADVMGKAIARLPVLMLMAYRPPDRTRDEGPAVAHLPHFTEIPLAEFTPAETRQLVALKLAAFFGEETEPPAPLLERVSTQAAGNPFYIEELLNYLQDLGIDPSNRAALEQIELPNSIHALVLSRIDQLSNSTQITIKVASVIGRLFRASMVWGIYPELELSEVETNLDTLSKLDLTPLDVPDPELIYLFKHVITQQVAYESLLHATRAMLHEQIGRFIERTYADSLDQHINLLAFHYEHGNDPEKKRTYLLWAGEAAQKAYANQGAITYFQKALSLLAGRPRVDTRLKLGKVLELTGAWDDAQGHYQSALDESEASADRDGMAWCRTSLGELERKRNRYDEAGRWFEAAQGTFEEMDNRAGLGQVLHYAGTLAAQQGDYQLANQRYMASLAIRRTLGDRENEANVLNNLGIVARYLGDPVQARRYHEESLAIQEELGNRWTTGALLNNLGHMAIGQGDFAYARSQLERALEIWREIGERWATTNTIHNLANVARDEGNAFDAQRLYAESVAGWRELDDNWGMAYWLEDTALFHLGRGEMERALTLDGGALALREQLGVPRPPAYADELAQKLAPAETDLGADASAAARSQGQTMAVDPLVALALA